MLIQGARVLLTGASGGIGCALTALLVQRGAKLIRSGSDETALRAATAADGDDAGRIEVADLTDEAAVHELAVRSGPVDILINNAGLGWYGDTTTMAPSQIRRLVEVNVLAPLLLTRLLLPGMLERNRGHLVFVGSIAGRLGVAREAVYSATKGALATYADALRAEVSGRGVGVTVATPGAVDTGFFRRRGTAYQRSWPPALDADQVARDIVRAIEHNSAEVFAPRWLRLPRAIHDYAPAAYRGLAGRFS